MRCGAGGLRAFGAVLPTLQRAALDLEQPAACASAMVSPRLALSEELK
jgi:hypothetical protein